MPLLNRLARPLAPLIAALALLSISVPAVAQGLTPAQKNEVEQTIRDYLLRNPELLIEVMQRLEERQQQAAAEQAIKRIQANRQALFRSPYDSVVNKDGTIPVVEFFDYQCAFCKRILPSIIRLQSQDPDVRFVYKELPILGEASVVASRAAIAARRQGKYIALHNALMKIRGRLNEDVIFEVAESVDLDVARLRADMERPEVQAEIDANRALANAMEIRGTPTMIVGDTLVPGALDYAGMTKLIAEARERCTVC